MINPAPLIAFKQQLDGRMEQLKHALPAHMPPERFGRVLLTAVQNNPDLLNADRQALWNACMKAAQDGLLPDGREGAIVIYKTKTESGGYERRAQWMPMVYGLLKKIRNSGQLAMITARVVYAGDTYRYWLDEDGEHIIYEPSETQDRQIVRLVFAAARTKDGELLVEPLTPIDIEKIRNVSRAKDKGPWVDWWDEMAKKSAIRRLAKRLPMSSDLDDLIQRDNDFYDLETQAAPRLVNMDSDQAAAVAPTAAIADAPRHPEQRAAPAPAQKAKDAEPTEREPTELERTIAADLIDCNSLGDVDALAKLYADDIRAASKVMQDAIMQQFANVREAIGGRLFAKEEDGQ